MKEKVVLGMSGGVDSSVAAYLLKKEGYEVIGLTMQLIPKEKLYQNSSALFWDAIKDAKKVAKYLEIPHYVVDMRDVFEAQVIQYFIEEYGKGHTPNPCIYCNKTIKFDVFFREAKKLGAKYIATGHYVNLSKENENYYLEKGISKKKDQSYFLYHIPQNILKECLFPLGLYEKEEIRKIAQEQGLPNYSRGDSEEICFVQKMTAGEFVEKKNGEKNKKGVFVSPQGKKYGEHKGIVHYTVGQRRGLGVAAGIPLYVSKIEKDGTIVLDGVESLYKEHVLLENVNFTLGEPDFPLDVSVKIRHGVKEYPAEINRVDGEIQVNFLEPARGIAIGQSAVFYEGKKVLGGGTMIKAW